MRLKSTIVDSILKETEKEIKEASFIDTMKEKVRTLLNQRFKLKEIGQAEFDKLNQRIDLASSLPALEWLNKRVLRLASRKKKAQTQQAEPPSIDKIMKTLQKGLPGLVTTLNMSASQAQTIFSTLGEKNAQRAYKKLVLAANLVQESLTLIGKIKL